MSRTNKGPAFAILVPIRVSEPSILPGLSGSIKEVLEYFPCGKAVIVDDSHPAVFTEFEKQFQHPRIKHFPGSAQFQTGLNNKLNAVEYGLTVIHEEFVLYTDDDIRLNPKTVERVLHRLEQVDCLSCSVIYRDPDLSDLINLISEFWSQGLGERAQPFGHCFFRLSKLKEIGFPDKNVIYDDFEFVENFHRHGAKTAFDGTIVLNAETKGWRQFWKQRTIYAYELLTYPLYFGAFLIQLPLCLALAFLKPIIFIGYLHVISAIVVGLAYYGRSSFLYKFTPWWSPLLAVFSWAIYSSASWVALALYLTIGIKFGPFRLKKLPKRFSHN